MSANQGDYPHFHLSSDMYTSVSVMYRFISIHYLLHIIGFGHGWRVGDEGIANRIIAFSYRITALETA